MHLDLSKGKVSIKEVPNIQFNVSEINRIGKEYGSLRQDSKAPT